MSGKLCQLSNQSHSRIEHKTNMQKRISKQNCKIKCHFIKIGDVSFHLIVAHDWHTQPSAINCTVILLLSRIKHQVTTQRIEQPHWIKMEIQFIILVLCSAVIRGNVLDLSTASIGRAEVRNWLANSFVALQIFNLWNKLEMDYKVNFWKKFENNWRRFPCFTP